jgi:hypothetical protein
VAPDEKSSAVSSCRHHTRLKARRIPTPLARNLLAACDQTKVSVSGPWFAARVARNQACPVTAPGAKPFGRAWLPPQKPGSASQTA